MSKNQLQMLPPAPDKCQVCAAQMHGDELPHNRDSLFYQMWFCSTYGRSPTWADASLNCSPEGRERLQKTLKSFGVKPELIGNFL